ncbi:serine/threonine protein kinase [Diaphorobacter sp. HDW4B]|uniref:serine/threonine-protein kinase n=1 Tax=Diaphorobacter sp. HDW4B TaxID=2714925 RepID=UPI00140DF34D|nr:serine/threonine-protein kinase [Diaphorobacter sp. HDW4B]QIL71643.1 serine/threonine protein kinase [Diaphorobacter sp. HDW4B]
MLKPFRTAKIDFQQIREIGQNGQNSKTHLVIDPQLNAEIVVKTIDKSKISSVKEYFSEAQALYSSSHPHVAQIHYACYDDDNVYIAMPFYKNGSIKELISGRYITVRQCITLATQILSAIHNIHSKGLIHFDIKPDNILLSSRREALLTDFGLAKQINQNGNATPNLVYGWMFPPEALKPSPQLDHRFDIYQFGITLYRMCNGNDHFYAQLNGYSTGNGFNTQKYQLDIENGSFPDRNSFLPHIPNKLRNVVKKCLKTDPNERYQSALEVINAISGIDGSQLDWHMEANGNLRTWKKTQDGVTCIFTADAANTTTGTKTSPGGAPRKKADWCKVNASEKDIYDMLAIQP